jgi:hypothetical protein
MTRPSRAKVLFIDANKAVRRPSEEKTPEGAAAPGAAPRSFNFGDVHIVVNMQWKDALSTLSKSTILRMPLLKFRRVNDSHSSFCASKTRSLNC